MASAEPSMKDIMAMLQTINAKVDSGTANSRSTSPALKAMRPSPMPSPLLLPSAPLCGWASPDVLQEKALFTKDQISKRVSELAAEVSNDYPDATEDDFVVVGLLAGVYMLMADFTRGLKVAHRVDFVAASSYGLGTVSSANVKIKKDLDQPIDGKHVLLIDEMCDTGHTMASLKKLMQDRGAASVKVCIMLDKKVRREADIELDYVGFTCPDEFVVGYGMDWEGRFRSLPDVRVVQRSAYEG